MPALNVKTILVLMGAGLGAVDAAPANGQAATTMPPVAEADCNVTMEDPGARRALYPAGTTVSTMVYAKKAKSDGKHFFDIPAGAPLGVALAFFLCASGGEATFPSDAFRRPSAGVSGPFPAREALEHLLGGTGLSIAAETPEGFVLK